MIIITKDELNMRKYYKKISHDFHRKFQDLGHSPGCLGRGRTGTLTLDKERLICWRLYTVLNTTEVGVTLK